MNQRKWGTILSYVHIFLSNSISLIYTPYMLRVMGKNEYGLFGTANSFISYLSILSFGIGGAYLRYNTRYRVENDKESEYRLNGMFLLAFSFLSILVLIGGAGCVIFAENLVKNTFTATEIFKLRIIMILLTINMAITFIFNVVTMALQAYEQFFFIRSVTITVGILTPIINIIVLNRGGRAVAISVVSLCFSIISYLVYLLYAYKVIKLRFIFNNFDKNVLKDILLFSGFLFLNSITDQITFSTDSIILSSVKGTSIVAIYTVGANFKGYFQQFSGTVSSVFAPKINLMVAGKNSLDTVNELFIMVSRIQFYIVSLILIGYASIGKAFVRLWAGYDYEESYYVGLLLMLSVCVPAFQSLGLEIQKALNKHKARSIVYFLIAVANISLTIPFSIWWGAVGAAAATVVSMVIGRVIFMNYYYHKYIGLDMFAYWKSIFSIVPSYIFPCGVAYVLNSYFHIDSLKDILLAACIITLTFSVSVWQFSMNVNEKNIVKNLIVKVKR